MKNQHMNPDDAVKMHRTLNSMQSMGIHFGTFAEHPEQTIDAHEKDLAKALDEQKIDRSRFWVLKFGEGRNVMP
jgi:L-ascorbate metabolism protein UlaG (beta-lactamase superfamily)